MNTTQDFDFAVIPCGNEKFYYKIKAHPIYSSGIANKYNIEYNNNSHYIRISIDEKVYLLNCTPQKASQIIDAIFSTFKC